MSGVRWEWRDEGSGPGHMQAVADDGMFSDVRGAYRALLAHCAICSECRSQDGNEESQEIRCEVASGLYRAWRNAGGPRAPHGTGD